ncbi:MAG: hypothetical protein HFI09_03575 [Bacilli bacterium]|nr:hypothetical protein [Bacilli bacterium]
MMKLSLKKVAIGATITGISVIAVRKMFHVERSKGISDIKEPSNNYRFAHQYPEPGQSMKSTSLGMVSSPMRRLGEEHFVNEEQGKSRTLSKNFKFPDSEV